MSWFGWLTKSRYEVSFLDKVIGVTEFFLLFAAFIAIMLVYWHVENLIKRWKKKRKTP